MTVLAVDIGGSHVKFLTDTGQAPRNFVSGPKLTPQSMVDQIKADVADWSFDRVTLGYPGAVHGGRIVADPAHLGPGWVGFDFEAAFGCPVRVMNDAAMQALGSYRDGTMLFLGLGTGLGTTLIVDGHVVGLEVGHLPYRRTTFEDYVSEAARSRRGNKKWRVHVTEIVGHLQHAFMPDDLVLGGGNVRHFKTLPQGCRAGDNALAFQGGFRAWRDGSK